MTRPTHILGGLAAGTLFGLYGIPFAILGSVLPDIDRFLYKKSSEWSFWGHRGFTHTVLFGYVLSFVIYYYLGGIAAIAFLFGVISHIILDGFNYKKTEPLFPIRIPVHLDIVEVGSIQEYLYFTIPLFLLSAFLIVHFNDTGAMQWQIRRLFYRY